MTRQFITERPVVKSILFNSTNILIYQFVYYTNVNLPLLSHLPNQLHRNKETFSEKHSPSILILQGTRYPTDFTAITDISKASTTSVSKHPDLLI